MGKVDYERILNQWKIYDEAERWSVKSLFRSTVQIRTNESFDLFLQQEVSKGVRKRSKIH